MSKHLVLTVRDGWIEYRMGDQKGSHPLGGDPVFYIVDYLKKIIPHETCEII